MRDLRDHHVTGVIIDPGDHLAFAAAGRRSRRPGPSGHKCIGASRAQRRYLRRCRCSCGTTRPARTAMPPPRQPSAAGWSAAAATGQPAQRPRLAHTGPSSRTPTAGRPHTGPRPPRPATRSAPPAPPADDAPPAISCPLRTHPDHQPRKRSTIAAVKMSRERRVKNVARLHTTPGCRHGRWRWGRHAAHA